MLKISEAVCRSYMRLGEMQNPHLEGAHRVSCALSPREKQGLQKNLAKYIEGGALEKHSLA